MNKQFSGKTASIVLHALAWIILIILPQYLGGRYFGNSRFFTWWFFVNTATYLVIFYVNYLFLVPRLFFKGKKLLYLLSTIMLLMGIYFLTEIANDTFFRRQRTERLLALSDSLGVDTSRFDSFREESGRYFKYVVDSADNERFYQDERGNDRTFGDSGSVRNFPADSSVFYSGRNNNRGSGSPSPPSESEERGPRSPNDLRRIFRPFFIPFQVYNYAVAALFFTFFSLGLKVMERQAGIEKRQKELEKEKLNSELALLKNQISPHFFFNTLNNIYSLIAINTEDSRDAVLKLSKLMRYLLYESEQGKTQLSNEIEFMINYIDLMRLRMSDKVSLSVEFPEKYENFSFPPLLFITFIENAFKHGISYRERSYINIALKIEHERLLFSCKNSIGKSPGENDEQYSGIGLDNVIKRLNLLFPGKYELNIDKNKKFYSVLLEIDIRDLKRND